MESSSPPLPPPNEISADAKWHNRLGSLLSASKKYTDAIPHFEQALDHAPHYAAAHFNLASAIVFDKGTTVPRHIDTAIGHFRQAIAIQPHFPDAHVNLAAQLYAQGRLDDALHHATTALTQDPDNTHAYYNLNTIFRALGQQTRAVDLCWHRILSSLPVGTTRPSLTCPHDLQPEESQASPITHITIVCVKWGVKYGADYVNKLYRGIVRHLTSVRFTFCCLTDDAVGLAPEIDVRQLAPGWVGWWNKAQVFAPSFGWRGRMLYVDLDTVFVGSLDDLALYSGWFGTLKTDDMTNERRVGGINSSVMTWHADGATEAMYAFLSTHFSVVAKCIYKFDHWLEMVLHGHDILQDLYPGQIVEYARECQAHVPPTARLVCFPLEPKPHTAAAPWVHAAWT